MMGAKVSAPDGEIDAETRLRLELEKRRRSVRELGLLDFIPAVSPEIKGDLGIRPLHLLPLVRMLEDCAWRAVRGLSSVARQHGKTVTIEHGMVWNALRRPGRTHVYITYQAEVAYDVSDVVKRIAERVGLEPRGPRDHWVTRNGDEFYFTGIGGPLTGRGISGVLYVDDPHKNREEAESVVLREKVVSWYRAAAISGVHESASAIVNHSRWHPADLIGQLSDEGLYEKPVNLPAVLEPPLVRERRPLWAEKYSLAFLDRRRLEMGEYDWASLMMGVPRLRGSAVFGPARFGAPPRGLPVEYGIGFDGASSEKTSADWSTAYLGAAFPGYDASGRACTMVAVLRGFRRQWSTDKVTSFLIQWQERFGCRLHWICSGTEKSTAILMRRLGLRKLHTTNAGTDKFVRAQPVATAWNRGAVLMPDVSDLARNDPRRLEVEEWLLPTLREVETFTGVGDATDDCVDGLAGLYNLLVRPARVEVLTDAPSGRPGASAPIPERQTDLAIEAMLRQQGY